MNLSATAALTRRPFSCHVWINVAQIQLSTLAILVFAHAFAALHCATQPSLETSVGVTLSPFRGFYPELEQHFKEAKLDPNDNSWDQVRTSIKHCCEVIICSYTFSYFSFVEWQVFLSIPSSYSPALVRIWHKGSFALPFFLLSNIRSLFRWLQGADIHCL